MVTVILVDLTVREITTMLRSIRRLALGLASTITITAAQAGFVLTDAKGRVGPIELYAPAQRASTFDGCKQLFPGGRPLPLTVVNADWLPRGLCSDRFAVLYSGKSKTPLVVVERLSRQQIDDADEQRTNEFFPDPRLPASERAYLDDYRGSVYDQATGRAWAHVLPNTSDAQVGAPMDYASFVRATGWDLLPGIALRGSGER